MKAHTQIRLHPPFEVDPSDPARTQESTHAYQGLTPAFFVDPNDHAATQDMPKPGLDPTTLGGLPKPPAET